MRIPNEPKNQNHVGTVHAAALVLAGETAGGLALLNEPRLSGYLLLAKGLSIRYRKPATGACSASATLSDDQVQTALAALAERGKVDVPLSIELRNDEGETLCEMTVDYHLRVRT